MSALALFVGLFVWADRWSGGGFGWDRLNHDAGGPLRGRGLAYAAVIVLLAVGLLIGWKAGLVASLTLFIWRAPGWKIAGRGSITPHSKGDVAAYFVRHLLAAVSIPMVGLAGLHWQVGLISVPLFATGAVSLGVWLANETDKGRDANGPVEMVRGGLLGWMLWTMLA